MRKFIAIIAALAAAFGMTAMAAYAAPKVTEEEARQTALKHAGLTPEQAQFKSVEYDSEEGRGGEYKLRFYAGNEEFKYEINAQTGGIMSCSQDMGLNAEFYGDGRQRAAGERKAIETALARVPGAKQSDIKQLKLDRDDKRGTAQYEGKIFYDKTDYKFEIDAQTGEILSWTIEY